MNGAREHIKKLNENPTENMVKSREEWIKKGRKVCETDEWKLKQADVMRKSINEYWKSLSKEDRSDRQKNILKNNPEIIEKQSKARKEYWKNLDSEVKRKRNKKSQENMTSAWVSKLNSMSDEEKLLWKKRKTASRYKKLIDRMIEKGVPLTEENFKFFEYKNKGGRNLKKCLIFKSFDEILQFLGEPYSNYNHKVKSVEIIKLKEDELVYDISVDKWHNFCVDAGVILHNCKDFRYRYSYLTYQLGYGLTRENRFPKIVNPDLKGSVCKHLLCVLTVLNNNWMSIQKDMVKTKWFRSKL